MKSGYPEGSGFISVLKSACEPRTSTPDFLIVRESGCIERCRPASKNQGTVQHERSLEQ